MNAVEGLVHFQESRFDRARMLHDGAPRPGTEEAKLKEVCRDFEAIFIKQMLDSMRKTVQKTGLLDGGMAEDIFDDMLYDEHAKIMSKTGSFGIADLLYRQFKTVLPNS